MLGSLFIGYQSRCSKGFLDLYGLAAGVLAEVQNNVNFHFALSGHNGASVLIDRRDKVGNIFTDQMKPHVTNKKLKAKDKEECFKSASGIFGDTEQLKTRVKEGQAESALLKSAFKGPNKFKVRDYLLLISGLCIISL